MGLNSPTLFDLALNNYVPIKQEEAPVGKTIMRYGVPVFGATTHASIFLGVDNSGNEYTFSKDGWKARPVVYNSRLQIQNLLLHILLYLNLNLYLLC